MDWTRPPCRSVPNHICKAKKTYLHKGPKVVGEARPQVVDGPPPQPDAPHDPVGVRVPNQHTQPQHLRDSVGHRRPKGAQAAGHNQQPVHAWVQQGRQATRQGDGARDALGLEPRGQAL